MEVVTSRGGEWGRKRPHTKQMQRSSHNVFRCADLGSPTFNGPEDFLTLIPGRATTEAELKDALQAFAFPPVLSNAKHCPCLFKQRI
eukprot:419077-Amphidinium_carterae.1